MADVPIGTGFFKIVADTAGLLDEVERTRQQLGVNLEKMGEEAGSAFSRGVNRALQGNRPLQRVVEGVKQDLERLNEDITRSGGVITKEIEDRARRATAELSNLLRLARSANAPGAQGTEQQQTGSGFFFGQQQGDLFGVPGRAPSQMTFGESNRPSGVMRQATFADAVQTARRRATVEAQNARARSLVNQGTASRPVPGGGLLRGAGGTGGRRLAGGGIGRLASTFSQVGRAASIMSNSIGLSAGPLGQLSQVGSVVIRTLAGFGPAGLVAIAALTAIAIATGGLVTKFAEAYAAGQKLKEANFSGDRASLEGQVSATQKELNTRAALRDTAKTGGLFERITAQFGLDRRNLFSSSDATLRERAEAARGSAGVLFGQQETPLINAKMRAQSTESTLAASKAAVTNAKSLDDEAAANKKLDAALADSYDARVKLIEAERDHALAQAEREHKSDAEKDSIRQITKGLLDQAEAQEILSQAERRAQQRRQDARREANTVREEARGTRAQETRVSAQRQTALVALDAEKAVAEERAQFEGRAAAGFETRQTRRRELVEAGQAAEEAALKSRTDSERQALQLDKEAATSADQREDIDRKIRDLDRDAETERIKLREQSTQESIKLSAQEAQERRGHIQQIIASENLLFRARKALGETTAVDEIREAQKAAMDPRRSMDERIQAFEEGAAKLRQLESDLVRFRKSLGTQTIAGEVGSNLDAAQDPRRDLAARVEAAASARQQILRIEAEMFQMRVSLGQRTLDEQISFERKRVNATQEGTQERLDAEKQLIAQVRQVYQERSALAGTALGITQARGVKTGTLDDVVRSTEAQMKDDKSLVDRFQKGGRVDLAKLSQAQGRINLSDQFERAGGVREALKTGFTPEKAFMDSQVRLTSANIDLTKSIDRLATVMVTVGDQIASQQNQVPRLRATEDQIAADLTTQLNNDREATIGRYR